MTDLEIVYPTNSNGKYVYDSRFKRVATCANVSIAVEISVMLNRAYEAKQQKSRQADQG